MNIDSFFTIGKAHNVCEDYALHGTDPFPHVIVSDGCSSSTNTDVGSRLLSIIARKQLHLFQDNFGATDPNTSQGYHDAFQTFETMSIASAFNLCKSINFTVSSLDATLLIAFKSQAQDGSERLNACIWGDGNAIFRKNDGNIEHFEIEYTTNAPYYLSYQLSEERNKVYIEHSAKYGDYTRMIHSRHTGTFAVTIPNTDCFFHSVSAEEYDMVMVASDGLGSLQDIVKGNILPTQEVVKNAFDFKNLKRDFVHRRFNRMLRNYSKDGIYNIDDVSAGAIFVG